MQQLTRSFQRIPLKSVAKWSATMLFMAVLLMALGTLLAPRFGWQMDKVLSGSMEPALKVGGVVVVRPTNIKDIKEGDIITYRSPTQPGTRVCHRVVKVTDSAAPRFQTKGDANDQQDPYVVPASNVEGKVVFHAPLLGYFAGFARSTAGFLLLIIIPGLAIIGMEIRGVWATLSEMESEKRLDRAFRDVVGE